MTGHRFSLLSIGALAFALSARAEYIHGRVLDPQNAAVAQAWVSLYSQSGAETQKARTNTSGEFLFERLAPGEYWIEASATGFAVGGSRLVRAGTQPIDIRLDVEPLRQRVAITAAGVPLSLEATAKALDVIDVQDIDARAEFSLAETLRQVPGMRVQQLGGPGSFVRLHTRGLRAYDTAILIDGFRLRDAAAPQGDATGYLGDLLIVDPARVEVLRGTGSSLYGTHAMGGVVQVVTNQGGGPFHGEFSSEGGGLGLFRGGTRMGGSALSNRLQFSAGLTHLNVTRGVDGDDRARNTSAQAYGQYRLSDRTRFHSRLFRSDAFGGLNSTPFAAPAANLPARGLIVSTALAPDQITLAEAGRPFTWGAATFAPALNDPDSRRIAHQLAVLTGLTHELRANTTLRVSYQGLATNRDNRDGPGGVRFPPRFNNSAVYDSRIDNANARLDATLGRHLISAGYEFERERFENISTDENPNPGQRLFARTSIQQRSNSVFAQDQIRLIGSRLLVSLSARWQGFAIDRPAFEGGAPQYQGAALRAPSDAYTGDVAIAYLVAPGTKLRTHFGNAYRAPALYERFGTAFFGGSFSPLGDPRLTPERSVAIDGGIDQYLARGRARLSATYFYTRLQNVIAYGSLIGQDPYGRFGGYLNTRGGLARGVEFSGEAHLTRSTRFNASYTHTRSQERTPLFADGLLYSVRIPRNMGTFLIAQRIGKRIEITTDASLAGESIMPLFAGSGTRAFLIGGLRKVDLTGSYTHPVSDRHRVQFFTRIDNMFNQTWYEDGFRVPKAWATAGLRWLF
ncbi:MAG: TonB-dependent receptor [Acidobacteria bacterium]|nr:TonB-dependent receptor [Acidobacteriota bacterium]